MDYSKLIKDLTGEMKKGVQYARIPNPFRIFTIIAMIPLAIAFVLTSFAYWVTLFVYKMIASPAEYLHQWLRAQKDEVKHATQAVMYYICLPAIFALQLLLSISSIVFFVQWFVLMVEGYLLTLGGIKWQPFITEATFGEEEEAEYKPENKTVMAVFSCTALGAFALTCLFALICYIMKEVAASDIKINYANFYDTYKAMDGIRGFFSTIHYLIICIVNPIIFGKVKK